MMHDGESQCAAMSHVTLNCIMKQLDTGCLQQSQTYLHSLQDPQNREAMSRCETE